MPDLHRYTSLEALHLPPEFLSGQEPLSTLAILHQHLSERLEPVRDLQPLQEAVSDTLHRFDQYDASSDAFLVVPLHRALALSRREAADRRVWAWLGVSFLPEYVAHRWAPNPANGAITEERYSGSKVRQAFARLWWAAELTRVGDDYSLTQTLFALPGIQDIYETIFGRLFCAHPAAVSAFTKEMIGQPQPIIRETAKQFSNVLTTMMLETLTVSDLNGLIGELRDGVVSGRVRKE